MTHLTGIRQDQDHLRVRSGVAQASRCLVLLGLLLGVGALPVGAQDGGLHINVVVEVTTGSSEGHTGTARAGESKPLARPGASRIITIQTATQAKLTQSLWRLVSSASCADRKAAR